MFVAFHAGAYFSLGGGVLLYFIVWVEVIKIQIDLKFIKDMKRGKKIFHFAYHNGPKLSLLTGSA
jgi:hypothetical protein